MIPSKNPYLFRPKNLCEAVLHINTLLETSVLSFLNGNPLVVRYFLRSIRYLMSGFILLDTDIVVDLIRGENGSFSHDLTEHINELFLLLRCFNDNGEELKKDEILDELENGDVSKYVDESTDTLKIRNLNNEGKEFNNLIWVISFVSIRFPVLFDDAITPDFIKTMLKNTRSHKVVEILETFNARHFFNFIDVILALDNLEGCCRLIEHIVTQDRTKIEVFESNAQIIMKKFIEAKNFLECALIFKVLLFLIKNGNRKKKSAFSGLEVDFSNKHKCVMGVQLKIATNEIDMVFLTRCLQFCFENPNLNSIFNALFPVIKNLKLPEWFYVKRDEMIRQCWAEMEGPRPNVPALFWYLIEMPDNLDPYLMEFVERRRALEVLEFKDTSKITDWLEDCLSAAYMEYLVSIIVEEIPDHEFFNEDAL